ncbi:uncharacterized protein N7469_008629 [Penicillium citrinum]|uniref:RING-type domain-containing protein n=1 Tax=Penicillium citrinum TaxID=5077 RepID=A0A9W9NLY8_PENCI|nr:uncharacterized protein N7469_008629 [Penicillium citrinum]KAJ5222389.1 hypothetical protein N7469_008629 [Penicillium citrinum]
MAVRYARINPEYLDYMDRQLWDIIELILECDEFSRRRALSKELAINRALKRELARETSDEPCPICADYIQPGEYITSLIPHCMHWLHGSCIGQWLMSGNANNGTCPMCRTVIPLDLGIPPPAPEIMDVVLFWEDHV